MSEQLRLEALVSEAIGEVGSLALRDAKLLYRLLETPPGQYCHSTDRSSFRVELCSVRRTLHGTSGAVTTGVGILVESSCSDRHVHCLAETVPTGFYLRIESGFSEEIGCCGVVACSVFFVLLHSCYAGCHR